MSKRIFVDCKINEINRKQLCMESPFTAAFLSMRIQINCSKYETNSCVWFKEYDIINLNNLPRMGQ